VRSGYREPAERVFAAGNWRVKERVPISSIRALRDGRSGTDGWEAVAIVARERASGVRMAMNSSGTYEDEAAARKKPASLVCAVAATATNTKINAGAPVSLRMFSTSLGSGYGRHLPPRCSDFLRMLRNGVS
jgi:hypothetical protein